jgi:serine kinase of HPr protein (carbohydrate metabolism regulator)
LADNFHATALLASDRGVLVAGPSGSGKTALALALIAHCRAHGVAGRLVSDDQVLLSVAGGRLVAAAPAPIAGLVELRGYGPVPVPAEARMVVDLLVRLVEPADAPRIAAGASEVIAGVALPRLDLPAGSARTAALAVAGFLRLPPFGP